jgi:2-dehydropantoate 2-reductase
LGTLLTHRFIRRLALEIMTEAVEVARAEGVHLVKIAGTIDLEKLALTPQEKLSSGSASLVRKHTLLLAVGARYRRLRSSMLSAIERGRKPSVDFLNGEVVSLADKHGIRVPVNALVQRTVHRIATGELRPSLDLLRRMYDETRAAN